MQRAAFGARLPLAPRALALWAASVAVAAVGGVTFDGLRGALIGAGAVLAALAGTLAYRRWPGLASTALATLVVTPLVVMAAPQQAVILAPAAPIAEIALAPLVLWVVIAAVWSHFVGSPRPWQLQVASIITVAFGGWALGIVAGSLGVAAAYVLGALVLALYPVIARRRQRNRPTAIPAVAVESLSASDADTVRVLSDLPDQWSIQGPITIDEHYADGLVVAGPGGVFAVSSRQMPGHVELHGGEVVNGSRPVGLDAAAASELAALVRRSLGQRDAGITVTAVLVIHGADIAAPISAVELRDDAGVVRGQVYVRTAQQLSAEFTELPQLWNASDLAGLRETVGNLTSPRSTGSGHRVSSTVLHAWAIDADGQRLCDQEPVHVSADPHIDPLEQPLQANAIVTVTTSAGMFVGVTASSTYLDADGEPVVDVRVPGLGAEQQLTLPANTVRST